VSVSNVELVVPVEVNVPFPLVVHFTAVTTSFVVPTRVTAALLAQTLLSTGAVTIGGFVMFRIIPSATAVHVPLLVEVRVRATVVPLGEAAAISAADGV
jgi:hypothetical protein